MQRRKLYILLGTAGLLLVIVTAIALAMPQTAEAQCGSQASSCKNCHEVQAKDPVNVDGTGWHQSHAFGDFCYICHGGNNQAKDKAAAHEGMVDPLADVKASCQQCHAADLDARAKVYADALAVEVGSGAAAPATGGSDAAAVSTTSSPADVSDQPCNQVVVNDSNAVNYAQNYDEI